MDAPTPDALWEQIAPHLEATLDQLKQTELDALRLRFMEEKTHPFQIDFENRHVRAQARRHARGIDAGSAAAVFRQKKSADEDRHAAGDFAPRFEQWQVTVRFDRFVRQRRHAGFQQNFRQRAVGGEMQIREKKIARRATADIPTATVL